MLPVANVIVVCLFGIGIRAPYISSWIAPVAYPQIHLSHSPCGETNFTTKYVVLCWHLAWEIDKLFHHEKVIFLPLDQVAPQLLL